MTIYTYPSMDYLVRENQDVIVSKTFSKVYGLAGLRIGYLVISRNLQINCLESILHMEESKIVAQTNVLAVELRKRLRMMNFIIFH